MSKQVPMSLPVLEWSASGCAVFDPLSKQTHRFASLSDAAKHVPTGRCIVALSRRTTFLRCVRVPNAGHAEVAQALEMQADSLFPVPGSDLSWTFRLTDDVSSEGRLAVLCAAPISTLKRVDEELRSAGVFAEAILPVSFGSALVARSSGLQHGAVLDRTDEGLAIDVVFGGEVRGSRVVPEPGTQQQLEAEVCRSFSIAGLACGPTIAISGLMVAGAEVTSQFGILEALSTGGQRLGITLELPELVAKRGADRVASRARLGVVCAIAALACAAVLATNRIRAQSDVRAADALWEAQIRKLESAERSISSKSTMAIKTHAVLNTAFEPGQRVTDVVSLIGNDVPAGVWLGGVTLERGKDAQVRGAATNTEAVTSYLDTLRAEDRFRDVKLMFANNGQIETTPIVNFSVSLHAIGNLPIIEAKKVARK